MRLQGGCARSGVGFAQLDRCAWGGVCTVGIFLCLVRIISRFGTDWSVRRESVACTILHPSNQKIPKAAFRSLWGFASFNDSVYDDSVRFNQSVFTVSTFVYDVCTIGFRIGEDEEIVAEHVHLENGFLLIHRFQIELFRTDD